MDILTYKKSVIVLVYNVELYLAKYLENILQESDTYKTEFILINMNSTDNSGKICNNYQKTYKNCTYIQLYEYDESYALYIGSSIAESDDICFITTNDIINGCNNINNQVHKKEFLKKVKYDISIVITCYNKEQYIERAINSVKNMNCSNWECVIVDNDSTDNSVNIILENIKNDKRFKLIVQTNKNVCGSRNAGAWICTSKYLTFLDGDDEIGKNFCNKAINVFNNNPKICLVGGKFRRAYTNGINEDIATIEADKPNIECYNFNFVSELYSNFFIVTSVILLDTFKKIGGFKRGAEYTTEDWEMFIRYLYAYKNDVNIYYIKNDITAILYETANSKTKTQTNNWTNKNNLLAEMYTENIEIYKEYNIANEIEKLQKHHKIEISYHVIDRCNRNCIACGHFAPLADKNDKGVTIEQFTNDMISLCKLKPYISKIILTGGEPTLHENLIELITIAKRYFDNVQLCSNGINLEFFKKNNDFLIKNNILLYITRYENTKFDELVSMFPPEYEIFSYFIPVLENEKTKRNSFYKQMLCSKKINTLKRYNCVRCLQFYDNKLYVCYFAANFHLLKSYFQNISFPFDINDAFIDINSSSIEEIFNFIDNFWPEICFHCKEPYLVNSIFLEKHIVKLTTSKKELSEFYEE